MFKPASDSARQGIAAQVRRLASRPEGLLLVIILVLVVAAWLFIEIADEVREGETLAFDRWALLQFREADDPSDPIGPKWVESIFVDITAIGGHTTLTLLVIIIAGYLGLAGKRHAMWLVLAASIGGWALSMGLKGLIARPRPDVVAHLVEAQSMSFPSGHAMMSAVIYLTLGVLLAQVAAHWALRLYALCVALVITFLVGISRVYLGVHYPTDVLAGWTAGLAWALLCWAVTRWLQRRGLVEKPKDSTGNT